MNLNVNLKLLFLNVIFQQCGEVIGTLNYWFKLQRPCEDIIMQFMRSSSIISSNVSGTKHEEEVSSTVSINIQGVHK